MRFILVSPKNRTAYNFRGDLIKRIISCGYEVIVTGPNRVGVEKIEALGARFVEIPMNKNGVNPKEDLKYQKALCELFKKEKPDVVLGYTSKPVIYGSIAAKKAGVPHKVAMITGLGYAFTAQTKKAKAIRAVMSVLYKKALNCADTVIFQNPDDREQFVSSGLVKSEKCRVVNGSGVNTNRFSVADYPDKITFFMLSRVMYSKGIREYLRGVRACQGKAPRGQIYAARSVRKYTGFSVKGGFGAVCRKGNNRAFRRDGQSRRLLQAVLGICFAVIPRGHSENGLGGDEHGQGDYNDRRPRVPRNRD